MAERTTSRRSGANGARRGRISDERWRKILDAAAEIFATKGYEATTIRDIAEAAGILGGSLYYYISTKEDLLFALIEDFHRLGSQGIAEVEAETEGRALEVLRAVIVRHVALNARNGARAAVFHNDFRHLDDERKREIVRSRRAHEDRIEELIRDAQEEGAARPALDPRLTALSVLSLLNSTHQWYRPDRGVTPEQLGELQADLLLHGLSVRATPRRRATAAKR